MDQMIWVEILSRHRDVIARHRVAGPEIYLGRDYTNDVVIDDPFVSSRHLRIRRDELGALIAEDLGSANGLFADRAAERRVRIELDPNQPIRIGHTLLRVRQADFAVAPERVVGARRNTWPLALALGVIILALEAASLWLVDVTEPKLSRYLLPLLYVTLIVFGWSAVWAVLSRIFTGHAQFERNLLIAVTGLLVYVVIDQIVDVASFAFSWRSLDIYQFVFSWTLLAAICFLHLNEIGPSRKRVKAALVGLLALIGIGTQSLAQFDRPATPNQQDFARQLLPPSLRLTSLRDSTAFLADIDRLRRQLERDRKEEPVASQGDDSFDDD
jgi:hypothetical protein